MSAILFNNPFAAPPPVAGGAHAATAGLALNAITAASGSSDAKDAALSNGSGAGSETSKQAETVAIFQKRQSFDQPSNATGSSVINAQAQTEEPEADSKIGANLPEVDMPDPLPTSPFLLQLKEAS